MPLNRPPLALGRVPAACRTHAGGWPSLCEEIGRPELVRVRPAGRLRAGHQRAAARRAADHGPDARHRRAPAGRGPRLLGRAADPPEPAARQPQTDDLLLTFGRGLSIVARCSDAWGAEIEDDGKVVWFAPAAEFAEGDGVPGIDHRRRPPPARGGPTRDRVRVHILDVPLALYVGFQHHFRELRREVRLLALAHESDYPLAKSLSDLFGSLERQLRDGIGVEQIETALARGLESTDLVVHMPRADRGHAGAGSSSCSTSPTSSAAQERLLSLARSPEQRRFQAWFLSEFVRQANGEPPHVVARGPVQRPRQRRHLTPSPRRVVFVAVALGGAVGALLRWWLGEAVPDGAGFPWTTFAINVSRLAGAGLLPALGAVRRRPVARRRARPGLLGGYTTLSAYAEQTRSLLDAGRPSTALAYVVGTLAACLVAVALVEPAVRAAPATSSRPRRATSDRAAGGARRRARRAAALRGRTLARLRAVPVRHLARQRGRLVPARTARRRPRSTGDWLALLGTGFCGGFTTYSAFAVQTHRLGPAARCGVRRRDRSWPRRWPPARRGSWSVRRSRARAAGRRRCRSGGRSRARR